MARAPYELESDNRWLGGWAPETLLGGLEAARSDVSRSWVGSRNADGWTAGGEVGRGEVGGGSRNAAGWTRGGEVAGGVVRGGSRNAAGWRAGGWVVHRRWGFSSVRRWGFSSVRRWEAVGLSQCRACGEGEGDRGSGGVVRPSHTLISQHKSRMGGWGIGGRFNFLGF
ncbi:uncharacterized protein DS421_10g307240 [Arachis hypogaea]|nr:uncharacterized protein DS421_10g307240 [Arachis hypogaea]